MEEQMNDTPPIKDIVKTILDNMGVKYKIHRTYVSLTMLDFYNVSRYKLVGKPVIYYTDGVLSATNIMSILITTFFEVTNFRQYKQIIDIRIPIQNNDFTVDVEFTSYLISIYKHMEYILDKLNISDNRRDIIEFDKIEEGIVVNSEVCIEEGYLEIEEFKTYVF